MLSVALSLSRAEARPAGRYPAPLFRGARTFLVLLAKPAAARPSGGRDIVVSSAAFEWARSIALPKSVIGASSLDPYGLHRTGGLVSTQTRNDLVAGGAILMMFLGAFILTVSSIGLVLIVCGVGVMLLLFLTTFRKR